jgi:hypothetical protein
MEWHWAVLAFLSYPQQQLARRCDYLKSKPTPPKRLEAPWNVIRVNTVSELAGLCWRARTALRSLKSTNKGSAPAKALRQKLAAAIAELAYEA